jgi:hypothetical protein
VLDAGAESAFWGGLFLPYIFRNLKSEFPNPLRTETIIHRVAVSQDIEIISSGAPIISCSLKYRVNSHVPAAAFLAVEG